MKANSPESKEVEEVYRLFKSIARIYMIPSAAVINICPFSLDEDTVQRKSIILRFQGVG